MGFEIIQRFPVCCFVFIQNPELAFGPSRSRRSLIQWGNVYIMNVQRYAGRKQFVTLIKN